MGGKMGLDFTGTGIFVQGMGFKTLQWEWEFCFDPQSKTDNFKNKGEKNEAILTILFKFCYTRGYGWGLLTTDERPKIKLNYLKIKLLTFHSQVDEG